MNEGLPYEKILQESLKDELEVFNAHLPGRQKSLTELLRENFPAVVCKDGSTHLFKKKELNYLAGLLTPEKQEKLLLPIIIEVSPGQDRIAVICRGDGEEEVVSRILGMPLTAEHHRIIIYGPQLAALRKVLKTTTQYLFSPEAL